MQLKRGKNNKLIAVALAALMMTSAVGTTLSMADTVEQTESITESTQENRINNNVAGEESGDKISNDNKATNVNSVNGEVIENVPENVSEENLESEDINMAAKTSAKVTEGFSYENGNWYFYSNGVKKKGWVDYKGVKYYILNNYKLPQNMWRLINGKKYYFNKDGVMIRDQKIRINGVLYQFNKDGYLVDNDNSKQEGVISPEQKEIYAQGEKNLNDVKSTMKIHIVNENGKWYKLVDGKKTRGWYEENGKKYYFLNTLNRAENMWRKINGKLYYFGPDGAMYANSIRYIGSQTYKFNVDGTLNESAATTVSLTDVSIRTAPDNKSKIIGKFKKGNGVEVLEKQGNYSKVRTGDGAITGWIPSSAIVRLVQEKINSVISVAKSKLGSPYSWGGVGPSSFDCSGLMLYAFKHGANITLPRVSKNQATVGRYVSRENLRPGDLVFWGNPVHHVALYIGDGKYIHAPQPGDYVRIVNLGRYTTARRVIE